ncbi:FAD-dependent oxidoreductase [Streptomyces sp. LHD-70]|uniref:NAD(P)/FAD-dependent oxidoreductase n=1 Tax=Streptomyces sp. LHD-70 TaxID=3072140 RepID=UPI00280DD852|nr:FAD-dependent oxidoreductase [Streptomyces sp. LHD-70]MDQ8704074.1 FAD-dependent oxidoreductase [Streptomyces sp. LHD-70]
MKITVIGAGVIGLSCAYELSALGHQVTVVDAGAAGAAASAGNAGWITPFLSAPRAAPGAVRDAVRSFTSTEGPARMRPHLELGFASWVTQFLRASNKQRSARATAALQKFARHAHEHVDSLLERGVSFEHYTDGLAVVFKQADNLAHYEQLAAKIRSLGYDGEIAVHRGSDVVAFDPAISRDVAGVLHLVSERHVRPETLTAGLAKALVANGGEVIEGDPVRRVTRLPAAGKWAVDTAEGRELDADHVVFAAGFATRALLKPLGVDVPLEAAKGTSMTAYGEGLAPSHPLKLYEHMVACSPFGNSVRLSGTFDIGRRDFDLNRKRLDMVVRHGTGYLDTWRPTDIEYEWVGHRSTTVDDTPIIGPVPALPGLYVATGHGTLGVTLGPATGALAAREIALQEEQPLLAPFRLTRFRARNSRTQNA